MMDESKSSCSIPEIDEPDRPDVDENDNDGGEDGADNDNEDSTSQPLPLTMDDNGTNGSRCVSPLSPSAMDANACPNGDGNNSNSGQLSSGSSSSAGSLSPNVNDDDDEEEEEEDEDVNHNVDNSNNIEDDEDEEGNDEDSLPATSDCINLSVNSNNNHQKQFSPSKNFSINNNTNNNNQQRHHHQQQQFNMDLFKNPLTVVGSMMMMNNMNDGGGDSSNPRFQHHQTHIKSMNNSSSNKINEQQFSNFNNNNATFRLSGVSVKQRQSSKHNYSHKNSSQRPRDISSKMTLDENLTHIPEVGQLLFEYRQVLLDVLANSFVWGDSAFGNDPTNGNLKQSQHRSVVLPIKCQCGFTSELSKHITRTSTYVHQLELKLRALVESAKSSNAGEANPKYIPKRPGFINQLPLFSSPSMSAPLSSSKSSLLEKKKMAPRLIMPAVSMSGDAQHRKQVFHHPSVFSGNNSSIASSLNGDDDDEEEDDDIESNLDDDDVNHDDNLHGNSNTNNAILGQINNGEQKTILEDYLNKNHKSFASNISSSTPAASDYGDEEEGLTKAEMLMMQNDDDEDERNHHGDDELEDIDVPPSPPPPQLPATLSIGNNNVEDEYPRGPGKRIDEKTKRLVFQLQRKGLSFTDISRKIGISRKSIRKIVNNYRPPPNSQHQVEVDSKESQIQKAIQAILKLYSQGRSYAQISEVTSVSKADISRVIKQYTDSSNLLAKNSSSSQQVLNAHQNGLLSTAINNGRYHNDDMDEEREMIVDEDAHDEELDDNDMDCEGNNIQFKSHQQSSSQRQMNESIAEPNLISSYKLFPKAQIQSPQVLHSGNNRSSSKKNHMSLIHGPYNNNNNGAQHNGFTHLNKLKNGHHSLVNSSANNNNNNRFSLIKQSSNHQERFKPYDAKMRNSLPVEFHQQHQSRSVKSHPIVPPLPNSNNNGNFSRQINKQSINDNHHGKSNGGIRLKNKMNRHSTGNNGVGNMSLFKESLIVHEQADKNNNTTMANCNVPADSPGPEKNEPNGFPSIPASLIEGNSDSDANLVPKTFLEGFPAGIMNSLNPNRATKLTLEDFNVVWQLRSQHWTHNQIRKYFQQLGKSISKSSISRIMNGKQRNFQQFFNVVPSSGIN